MSSGNEGEAEVRDGWTLWSRNGPRSVVPDQSFFFANFPLFDQSDLCTLLLRILFH